MTITSSPTSLLTDDIAAVLEDARKASLTRDNPRLSDLPGWFDSFRDHQRIAIREILTAYEEGAECVVLDAPTGSGKTVVGEAVRRILHGTSQLHRGTTYICSSKSLQDQFVRDYPYAKVLKGRSNYPTESYPERFGGKDGLSCSDCTKTPGDSESCLWCVDVTACPYEQAKSMALRSPLAILNTSYFLSECNGPGRFSRGGFVIADESDCLEGELLSHVEVRISERRLKGYGLGVPKYVTKEESWVEWAEDAYAKVQRQPPRQRRDIPSDLVAVREAKRHAILVAKLKELSEGIASGGWVYTGDRNQVSFKPITVNKVGAEKFWRHGSRFLLMSATVISADEMLESLGWPEDKQWRLVKVPSTFPPENRKVVVWPVASMTYKERDEAWPAITKAVVDIASEGECASTPAQTDSKISPHSSFPNGKILVHSSSYALTIHIAEGLEDACLGRPIFYYTNSHAREDSFNRWQESENGIMVAPSLDRGIDLPGDKCRTQIIVKVPFLSLQDKQVSTRLYGTGRAGKLWYQVNAIRTIVQMCGRAVRSEDDWCTTWIIDSQFVSNLWGNSRRLFPQWFKDALVWRMKGL